MQDWQNWNDKAKAPNRKGVRKNHEKQKTKPALDIGGMSGSAISEIRQNPDASPSAVVRTREEDEMKTENKIINIGAVCDKRLIDRLDAIANKHMRSRAKEITLAIMAYVQAKENEKQEGKK